MAPQGNEKKLCERVEKVEQKEKEQKGEKKQCFGISVCTQVSPIELETDPGDLVSEVPSQNYFEVLAEKRRIALASALKENEKLSQEVTSMRRENRILWEMLDESREVIKSLTERVAEDESGINHSVEDFP